MSKTYVTFGFDHRHHINGKDIDHNCVVAIECENAVDGRRKAFELFGNKFCFEYNEACMRNEPPEVFLKIDEFYPRGIIEL